MEKMFLEAGHRKSAKGAMFNLSTTSKVMRVAEARKAKLRAALPIVYMVQSHIELQQDGNM